MRKFASAILKALAVFFWALGDAIWQPMLARGMAGPMIPEPGYSEQDTQPYDTEATQTLQS